LSQDENQSGDGQTESSSDLDLMIRQGRSFSGLERNCCFLNTKGADGRFANISAIAGIDFPDDGRALAICDWDHDGDLDVWVSNRNAPRLRFMRNDLPSGNRYLQIRLRGNGVDTNRDAVGARVTVELDQQDSDGNPIRLHQTLRVGEGFISQSTNWIHFGLGTDSKIANVYVRWPNRSSSSQGPEFVGESFGPLQSNQRVELRQGNGDQDKKDLITTIEARNETLAIQPSKLEVPPAGTQHRIPLVYQLPAPPLGYFNFDNEPVDFPLNSDHVFLVNIWSSTCRPCLKELSEFSKRYAELEQAGVKVLAISVDALESDTEQGTAAAKRMAEQLKMPFDVGMAPPAIVDELRRLHNILIKMDKPLPLPTSFLIDRDGNLDIIYKGTVSVETLIADSKRVQLSPLARYERSASFEGTTIDNAVINSTLFTDKALIHLKMAREYANNGRRKLSIEQYEKAAQIVTDSSNIFSNLATQLQLEGDSERATQFFEQAIEISPEEAWIRVNFGQSLMAQNKSVEAKKQFEEAIRLSPKFANAYFNLGVLNARMRDMDSAQECYETAVRFDPTHARALFGLGKLHEFKKRYGLAKQNYELALKAAPKEASILVALAVINRRDGKITDAKSQLELAVKYQPSYPEAHYQLGLVYEQARQIPQARSEFQTTLELDARHREARAAMARLRKNGTSNPLMNQN